MPTAAGEPALCYYTSGTTREPKAVLHAHAYTFAHRYTGEHWLDAAVGHELVETLGGAPTTGVDADGRAAEFVGELDTLFRVFHFDCEFGGIGLDETLVG